VEDETVLVVPPAHPLARRKRLQPKQLDGLEIVSREPGSESRALAERFAARANIELRVKFETEGVDALKEAVLQGFGGGFVSRLAVQRELEAGTLAAVHVDTPELVQHIRMAYPAAGQCAPAVSKFADILHSAYAAKRKRR
jgi:DNA-binding transcriptional LysR family regulator